MAPLLQEASGAYCRSGTSPPLPTVGGHPARLSLVPRDVHGMLGHVRPLRGGSPGPGPAARCPGPAPPGLRLPFGHRSLRPSLAASACRRGPRPSLRRRPSPPRGPRCGGGPPRPGPLLRPWLGACRGPRAALRPLRRCGLAGARPWPAPGSALRSSAPARAPLGRPPARPALARPSLGWPHCRGCGLRSSLAGARRAALAGR